LVRHQGFVFLDYFVKVLLLFPDTRGLTEWVLHVCWILVQKVSQGSPCVVLCVQVLLPDQDVDLVAFGPVQLLLKVVFDDVGLLIVVDVFDGGGVVPQ